jgi:hypothetical protein
MLSQTRRFSPHLKIDEKPAAGAFWHFQAKLNYKATSFFPFVKAALSARGEIFECKLPKNRNYF